MSFTLYIYIYIYIYIYTDRQSRIAWQTINEVSRRKNTAKAKLKAANQQERIKLWKQHFENLLGNPPKITHEPITRIISKQLDNTNIQQLCEDTGCCPEDLPRAMNDREEW